MKPERPSQVLLESAVRFYVPFFLSQQFNAPAFSPGFPGSTRTNPGSGGTCHFGKRHDVYLRITSVLTTKGSFNGILLSVKGNLSITSGLGRALGQSRSRPGLLPVLVPRRLICHSTKLFDHAADFRISASWRQRNTCYR